MPFYIRLVCDFCGAEGDEYRAPNTPIDFRGTIGLPVPGNWYFGLGVISRIHIIGDDPDPLQQYWIVACPACRVTEVDNVQDEEPQEPWREEEEEDDFF